MCTKLWNSSAEQKSVVPIDHSFTIPRVSINWPQIAFPRSQDGFRKVWPVIEKSFQKFSFAKNHVFVLFELKWRALVEICQMHFFVKAKSKSGATAHKWKQNWKFFHQIIFPTLLTSFFDAVFHSLNVGTYICRAMLAIVLFHDLHLYLTNICHKNFVKPTLPVWINTSTLELIWGSQISTIFSFFDDLNFCLVPHENKS
jgi:hypothetical protein